MRALSYFDACYLCRRPIDGRKAINGLAALVEGDLNLDVFSSALFVFVNQTRTRLKILYWDRTGFALWIKRLEKDRFHWPESGTATSMQVSSKQLRWLLDGYDIAKMKPHCTLEFSTVL